MAEVKTALEQISSKAGEPQPSIAVLPFANMSADLDNEYFSDGLAEEIINALAHIPGLKVIARTSVFAFKGKNEDVRRIADVLGVDHILLRQRAKGGPSHPGHRATHRRRRWDASVVGTLRPGNVRHLRLTG
ncbi:MAG: hypothetical protein DMG57_35865 [Acidobacteria bacterium]|nr:MAG: hypothetical protein DMG57_35865 [Acidobacteriota bacterium]